jgi:hypothetical protein
MIRHPGLHREGTARLQSKSPPCSSPAHRKASPRTRTRPRPRSTRSRRAVDPEDIAPRSCRPCRRFRRSSPRWSHPRPSLRRRPSPSRASVRNRPRRSRRARQPRSGNRASRCERLPLSLERQASMRIRASATLRKSGQARSVAIASAAVVVGTLPGRHADPGTAKFGIASLGRLAAPRAHAPSMLREGPANTPARVPRCDGTAIATRLHPTPSESQAPPGDPPVLPAARIARTGIS